MDAVAEYESPVRESGPPVSRFVHASFPAGPATELAARCDFVASVSRNFVAKTAIAYAFGENAIRPWRLVAVHRGVFHILAPWSRNADIPVTSESRALGFCVTPVDWRARPGERLALRVLTPATISRGRRGRSTPGARYVVDERGDVRLLRPAPVERHKALREWGRGVFTAPRAGLDAASVDIEIAADRPDEPIPVKNREGRVTFIRMPIADLRIHGTISNAGAFAALLAGGVNDLRHLGYGAVIPEHILTGVEL